MGEHDECVGPGMADGDLMAGAFQAKPGDERDVVIVFDQE